MYYAVFKWSVLNSSRYLTGCITLPHWMFAYSISSLAVDGQAAVSPHLCPWELVTWSVTKLAVETLMPILKLNSNYQLSQYCTNQTSGI